jgi:hypothetical protein
LNDAQINKGHKANLSQVLEALKALSCFDAWTCLDQYWKLSQQQKYLLQAKKAIAKMLTMIHDHLPCEAGNGWKLPTFHNTMHLLNGMCKNGKPKESNTEVGEKNHNSLLSKGTQNICLPSYILFIRFIWNCKSGHCYGSIS